MTDYKVSKEYKTISQIAGPLVFVKKTEPVGYQEMVSVRLSDGTMKRGQVLDSSDDMVVVQIFEGTTGIDRAASVRFLGDTMKMPVSRDMLGRILSGAGQPLDGGSNIIPDMELNIEGAAINPWARDNPAEF
ncbi:MAG: V-type ATP synthase subunit B, partial [Euryarchaeota archaeon]|nr:V-type ATP synthase subunit B [Euryarchaeota archaeon]